MAEGLRTRREVFAMGGAGVLALLAACSSDGSPSGPASGTPSSTGAAATRPPVTKSAAPASAVDTIGTAHVVPSLQVSVADASRYARAVVGTWRGKWSDNSGQGGNTDVVVALDVRTLLVHATVSVDGPIAGGPIAPATYVIDLRGFDRTAPTWFLDSPQLGKVTVTPSSGTALSGTAADVPGYPGIDSVEVLGTRTSGRIDAKYTINKGDGSTVLGTIAWSSSGVRATPAVPGGVITATPGAIASGDYAAAVATAKQWTAALGPAMKPPVANGGRIGFVAGIDASNATVESVDGAFLVQYSLFRATTKAIAQKYWHAISKRQAPLNGPWAAGYVQNNDVYVLQGNDIVHVNVAASVGTASLSPATTRRYAVAAARLLAAAVTKRGR